MNKKEGTVTGRLIPGVLAVLMCFCLAACGQNETPTTGATEKQNVSTATVETYSPQHDTTASLETEPELTGPQEVEGMLLKTEIVEFVVPMDVSEYLKHVEVVQDGIIMNVFYAVHEDLQVEAFRILFSSSASEKDIGAIKLTDGYLYISVSVNDYPDDEFENEGIKESFYTVISVLGDMLDSVQKDERFREKNEMEIEQVDQNFKYWNITLPEQMRWEESTENGYFVTFYYDMGEERIALYAISIGNPILRSEIGFYLLEGDWKIVSLESYELPETDGWSDAQITELYTMMSTINDVLQTITSSENYAEEMLE